MTIGDGAASSTFLSESEKVQLKLNCVLQAASVIAVVLSFYLYSITAANLL